jgi:cytochrome P450
MSMIAPVQPAEAPTGAVPGSGWLSGSIQALHDQGRWGWLRENREQLPVAVDELIRFVSPVMHFRRTATQDTELQGQHIRAGDKVVMWYSAANRDPAVFADPHSLDLTRNPNPRLAFGVGPHICLGSHLAKLEMRVMLDDMLSRFSSVEVTGDVERMGSNFINGIHHLPVRVAA